MTFSQTLISVSFSSVLELHSWEQPGAVCGRIPHHSGAEYPLNIGEFQRADQRAFHQIDFSPGSKCQEFCKIVKSKLHHIANFLIPMLILPSILDTCIILNH